MNVEDLIKHNEKVHDNSFDQYDEFHKENIFSAIEQERLANEIRRVKDILKTNNFIKAIDIGCGTGNLTNHFLKNGFQTTAADVSQGFLDFIDKRFEGHSLLSTFKLNGKDFKGLNKDSFDLVAVYSVLHHIPDYLAAVRNMAALCRPNGLIFIDHEVATEFWKPSTAYKSFLKEVNHLKPKDKISFKQKVVGRLRNTGLFQFLPRTNPLHPKFQYLGDIHVWPDEHIQWDLIEQTLKTLNFEPVYTKKYLHYKNYYPLDVFKKYQGKCVDHQIGIFQKK